MGIPSAPGIKGVPAGTRGDPVKFSQDVIERMVPVSVTNRIAKPTEDVGMCGTVVKFRDAARGQIQEHQNGGHNKPRQVALPAEREMRITDCFSFNDFYTRRDYNLLMCNDPSFISDRVQANMEVGTQELDKRILREIVNNVDPMNQGNYAGFRSQDLNMGSCANPVTLSTESAFSMFMTAVMLFGQREISISSSHYGTPYILGPIGTAAAIRGNDKLSSYFENGPCVGCPSVHGVLQRQVEGFDVIESNCLPRYKGKDGKVLYPIVLGFRCATRYSIDFMRRDMIDTVPGELDVYSEGYWFAGYKVIDPRLVARFIVCLDIPGM